MVDPSTDSQNYARLGSALDRWIHTGEVIVACLEKVAADPNVQRVRALKDNVQQLQQLIAQLRG
jgi:hypothetical protein